MPRGRGRGGGWQSNLARANFFPLLTKPNKAVGNKYCHVPERRWDLLEAELIHEFTDEDGLLNEFALMHKVRVRFPLHYTVFKQVSSHLCHEGVTEQVFSVAGDLSDENGRMDPYRLSVWTSIGMNKKVYQPPVADILARYMTKYGKGAKADGEQ